jgi:hypothetical protein
VAANFGQNKAPQVKLDLGNPLGEQRPVVFTPIEGAQVPLPVPDPRNPILQQRGYGERPVKVLPQDRKFYPGY